MQFSPALRSGNSTVQVAMQNIMLSCCMPCLTSAKRKKAGDLPAPDIETGPVTGLHMPNGLVLDRSRFTALVRLVDQEQGELQMVADRCGAGT
jgi:hypothetical protein